MIRKVELQQFQSDYDKGYEYARLSIQCMGWDATNQQLERCFPANHTFESQSQYYYALGGNDALFDFADSE